MKNSVKTLKENKGFTLIELLVVVLIIGILAAIALPQYQMAVGKARFSELKTLTKSVQDAVQRYYMVNNTYVGANINNLDIDMPESTQCTIWNENQQPYIACRKNIFGKMMSYYVLRETGLPALCLTYSIDINDKSNRLCQKETGKTAAHGSCVQDSYCLYYY